MLYFKESENKKCIEIYVSDNNLESLLIDIVSFGTVVKEKFLQESVSYTINNIMHLI